MPSSENCSDTEIEITPEMIEAGVEELYCHDITEPRKDEMCEAVANVYRVMAAVFAKESSAE